MGSAKRAYEDLTNEEGKSAILRPTLLAKSINEKYDKVIIVDIINKEKFIATRYEHHKYIMNEPNKAISRFSYVCDMETPDGIFYMFPVLKESDTEVIENDLFKVIKGVKSNSLVIESTIIGNICYRKFDNLYSDQYKVLVKRKLITPQQRTSYK